MYNHKLGVYHMMIVSKYFESIDDFINLELATPKAKGNMSKFHFNPIPLDTWSRTLFTSLETLHVYTEKDYHFETEQFYRRIIHYPVKYSEEWEKNKKENIEYKHVILDCRTAKTLERIPEEVTRIGNDCFTVYNTITEIIMPNSVTCIDGCSFSYVYNLTRIVLSTNLKEISHDCLNSLISLKEIEIPDSVTSIGCRVLYYCDQLTSITIPTHWELIGDRFMNNRQYFCSFQIPSSIKTINGKEVMIEKVKEFNIPSYATKLSDGCFYESAHTKITIPTTIKELPDSSFRSCQQLKSINIPTSVTKLGDYCFDGCQSLTSLIIPTSVVEIGTLCFFRMRSLKSIEIPSSVTKFGQQLLNNCKSLTSVTLHDNYKEVEWQDFNQCTSLSSITLPSTLTRINQQAFFMCKSLTSINLENIKEIGNCCFHNSGIKKENYPEVPDRCFKW